jgi:hypothetical protein
VSCSSDWRRRSRPRADCIHLTLYDWIMGHVYLWLSVLSCLTLSKISAALSSRFGRSWCSHQRLGFKRYDQSTFAMCPRSATRIYLCIALLQICAWSPLVLCLSQ